MRKRSALVMLWKQLGSVKLAFVLLWLIIVISFVGALLPSERQPFVYSSVWFFCLLGCFAVNILVCCVDRLLFNRKKIGSTITHAAVLVILAGSLVSVVFGFRGTMELTEGESSGSFMTPAGSRGLPFTVKLDDFSLEWYAQALQGYPVRVRIEDADIMEKFSCNEGNTYPVGATGYAFTVLRYFPHFALDEEHDAINLSDQPLNPALQVSIAGPHGREDRWIFALHPDIHMGGDPNIRFRFDLEPQIKAFRSRVTVTDAARRNAFTQDIKVNSPLEYRGYRLYQSRYDSEGLSWTGLDVVYDPGVPVVFFGFILLNVGIIAVLYPKLRSGRIPVTADNR